MFQHQISPDCSYWLEDTVVFKIFQQLVDAVAHLHDHGYAHHDLKPSNVLVNEYYELKLIDFGLVEKASDFCRWCGTAAYMPPEHFKGVEARASLAFAHDMWALGIIFYEMYFGHLPFETPQMCKSQSIVIPEPETKPAWVISLLQCLLAFCPEDRPKAREVQQFLKWVIQTRQVSDQ